MNEIATSPSLSSEEQELHELLDRVLGTTTTRPILDGIGARLESLQDEVVEAIDSAKASVTGQIRGTERSLRSAIEDGLDRLQGRVDAELAPALRELQTETRERLDRLESLGGSTESKVESLVTGQQTVAAITEKRHTEMLAELRGTLGAIQAAQAHTDSSIAERITKLEGLLSEQQAQAGRTTGWMLVLQGLTLLASISVIALSVLGGLQ